MFGCVKSTAVVRHRSLYIPHHRHRRDVCGEEGYPFYASAQISDDFDSFMC